MFDVSSEDLVIIDTERPDTPPHIHEPSPYSSDSPADICLMSVRGIDDYGIIPAEILHILFNQLFDPIDRRKHDNHGKNTYHYCQHGQHRTELMSKYVQQTASE